MDKLKKIKARLKKIDTYSFFQFSVVIALILFMVGANMQTVLATGPDADTLWDTIANFVGTWVSRLGGVVLFIGGIMFAAGWRSDDAEARSRGVATMISGGMTMALALLVGIFFGTE